MDHLPTSARASARAMQNLIIPALQRGDDALAVEQAYLVRDLLLFVADRVHLVGIRLDRQRSDAIGLASDVVAACADSEGPAVAALKAALGPVSGAAPTPSLDPDRSMELVDELEAGVSAVVREVTLHGDQGLARRLQHLVLVGMRARNEVDRAWLAPMGFDPEPASVGDLCQLLGIGHEPQPLLPAASEE